MNHEERIRKIIKLDLKLQWPSLYDANDAYILIKGTITVAPATAAAPNNANKKVIFENWAPFTSCINIINNTQADDPCDTDVVMPMYNLIE